MFAKTSAKKKNIYIKLNNINFYCIFNHINATLKNIRKFFQKLYFSKFLTGRVL